VNENSGTLDILLHPRLPPLVRPVPSLENVSLFRVEESEVERELRAMLGLTIPEDPEPEVSAQLPPQTSSTVFEGPAQAAETTPSRVVPNPTPSVTNSSNPPAQSSNDMQVDQTSIPSTLPRDQTPVEDISPTSNPTPPTVGFSERIPPVFEPPQPPSWNPIAFVGDEDEEEEEEIPSINMDSDSD
jgi:hypothetical protein